MNSGMPTKPMDITIHEMTTLFPEHSGRYSPLGFQEISYYMSMICGASLFVNAYFLKKLKNVQTAFVFSSSLSVNKEQTRSKWRSRSEAYIGLE